MPGNNVIIEGPKLAQVKSMPVYFMCGHLSTAEWE